MDAITYLQMEADDPHGQEFESFSVLDEGEDYCFFGIEKGTMRCRYIYGIDPPSEEGSDGWGCNFDLLSECRDDRQALFTIFMKNNGLEVELYDTDKMEEGTYDKPAFYERVKLREYLVDIHVPLLVRCPASAFNVEHAGKLALADLKAQPWLYAFRVEDYINDGTVNFVWKPEDLESDNLPALVADLLADTPPFSGA